MSPPPAVETIRPRRPVERRHRSGAWKVAYADFVTAMMALFIVLWMMNSSTQVKHSITGYFRDPKGYTRALGSGPANSGESLPLPANQIGQLHERIEAALRQVPEFQKLRNNIQFSVTGEGLRIDLLESEQGMFFVSGSPTPTPAGEHLLAALAEEVSRMGNEVVIEGHTDSRPFRNAAPAAGYSNWELSADRANAARRMLHAHGLPPRQVIEVRGFADHRLIRPEDPADPRNRRISIVVRV
jgi:chemotaxis protein MotB